MLEIDRTVSAEVAASSEECMAILAAVERYPEWSSLIKQAEVVEPGRVRLGAEVLGLPVGMECAIELGADGAVLTRIPHGPDDGERYTTEWTVRPGEVTLHVTAALDVPGPARLVRGRVEKKLVDELLGDFVAHAGSS